MRRRARNLSREMRKRVRRGIREVEKRWNEKLLLYINTHWKTKNSCIEFVNKIINY